MVLKAMKGIRFYLSYSRRGRTYHKYWEHMHHAGVCSGDGRVCAEERHVFLGKQMQLLLVYGHN